MTEKETNQISTGFEIKTFSVPFDLDNINQQNLTFNTNNFSKDQIINEAFIFHSKGQLSEAAKYYQYFINQGFSDERVFSNYGIILKDTGKLNEAEIVTRKAIEINSNFANAHYNLGNILRDLGKSEEARVATQKAINLRPDFIKAHSNLGLIYKDLGRLKEAEISTRKAIDLNPDLAELHANLGLIFKDLGRSEEAQISTQKAIDLKPDFAEAYSNLGSILKDLGKLKEAEIALLKAIELKPEIAESYSSLAITLLSMNEFDRSFKYFKSSAELLRGPKSQKSNHKRYRLISQAKIEHDIEQFEYLASQGYETKRFSELANLYKNVANEINWPSETQLLLLDEKYKGLLQDSYNRIIHKIEAPKLNNYAVNNSLNVEKTTEEYFDHESGLAYIDNFLTPEALASMRNFLLCSTIWFDIKKDGYIGAYLEEGLANPLILQIAEELRTKFPRIFKDHPVTHIWAYKYDSRAKNKSSSLRGINAHADFASVNVNFWITSSESNLNHNSGGLVVYDVEAPKEWDFKTYNNDEIKIQKELKKSKGNTKVIPYKGNRAVVFNSNLFHETDTYEFKDGYENRRINVTMLFGTRT